MEKGTTCVLIPAYEPDYRLCNLIAEIKEVVDTIIVIDDGSGYNYSSYFEEAEKLGCVILRHFVNQGKGRALKTAFNYLLENQGNISSIVTVDSDGQHIPKDIIKCLDEIEENTLVLGTRNFYSNNVPLKSRFGNVITRNVLKLLCGITISDTQTGLRAFPVSLLEELLKIEGERFEYEMVMLLQLNEKGVKMKEVPIETVYLEGNKSTHFNPIVDSMKIYKVFGRFILSSSLSFLLDFGLYWIFLNLFSKFEGFDIIIVATIGARILSSLFNYFMNRNVVFQSSGKNAFVKYYILCCIQMIISGICTSFLANYFHFGKVLFKLVVDIVLFMLSYQIQRKWVFKNDTH